LGKKKRNFSSRSGLGGGKPAGPEPADFPENPPFSGGGIDKRL
jgi:hypothetical protein